MAKRKTQIAVQLVLAVIGYAALVLGSGPRAYAGIPTAYPGTLTIVDGLPVPACDCTSATKVNCACIVNLPPPGAVNR
jgi:hypothetical protein